MFFRVVYTPTLCVHCYTYSDNTSRHFLFFKTCHPVLSVSFCGHSAFQNERGGLKGRRVLIAIEAFIVPFSYLAGPELTGQLDER